MSSLIDQAKAQPRAVLFGPRAIHQEVQEWFDVACLIFGPPLDVETLERFGEVTETWCSPSWGRALVSSGAAYV
eukprot:1713257-Pyramimonas_sp.AAC.1